jgi:hypothetical protein
MKYNTDIVEGKVYGPVNEKEADDEEHIVQLRESV